MADTRQRIWKLLDAIRDDFPRRLAAHQRAFRKYKLECNDKRTIHPPEKARSLPTFDRDRQRRYSPMLKARFDYAGEWSDGSSRWLGPERMAKSMQAAGVRSTHKSLRDHWEDSAPMLFADSALTLLATTPGVPENLTYLVWRPKQIEPEIWRYEGMNSQQFQDFADYLQWMLDRK